LSGNWLAARILSEQTVKSINWTNPELRPITVSDGVAINAGNTPSPALLKKKAGTVSQASPTVGEADVQSFYRRQRHALEDKDMRGVSGLEISELTKKIVAATKTKTEDRILTSVLASGSSLASDLRSILLLQHTQTVTHDLS
jgi:hypothetical protein